MLEFQTFYFAKKSRRRSISTHHSISHKIYTEDQFLQIQFKHINGDKYSVYGCQSKKLCGQLGPTKFPFSCVAGLGMPHRNFHCILYKSYIFANGQFLSNEIWADSLQQKMEDAMREETSFVVGNVSDIIA